MSDIKQITIGNTTYQIKDNVARTSVVNHGTSDTTLQISPNILHVWGTVPALVISFATPTDNTIENEYRIRFESGSNATDLTLPNGVIGAPTIEANKIYEISISDNLVVAGSWEVSL